jgi:hypothetical protein
MKLSNILIFAALIMLAGCGDTISQSATGSGTNVIVKADEDANGTSAGNSESHTEIINQAPESEEEAEEGSGIGPEIHPEDCSDESEAADACP